MRLIGRIRQLLYEEGYTIPGARKKIESEGADVQLPTLPRPSDPGARRSLIRSAGDKAGGAALNLAGAERIAERIVATLDRSRPMESRS